jgi:hypothetical protein
MTLARWPDWCCYLATGDLVDGPAGCYVHLERNAGAGRLAG